MPEYPKVMLLGYVEDEVGPGTVARLEQLVAELVQAREDWADEPPEFVDNVDSAGVRTCGVLLWLTDMQASEAVTVSEVDRRELADVKAVVDALAGFSGRTGLTIGFEYGGDSAGWIEAGQPDELIREGLIGEWERCLPAD
jgi:hypothetical protein